MFVADCIISKDLLLDDRMDALRDFLHRNKDTFDFNGPDNGIPVYKLIGDAPEIGGYSSHKNYNELIKSKILDAKERIESPEDLDDEIYKIIKNARKAIEENVVSTGETGKKVNKITF